MNRLYIFLPLLLLVLLASGCIDNSLEESEEGFKESVNVFKDYSDGKVEADYVEQCISQQEGTLHSIKRDELSEEEQEKYESIKNGLLVLNNLVNVTNTLKDIDSDLDAAFNDFKTGRFDAARDNLESAQDKLKRVEETSEKTTDIMETTDYNNLLVDNLIAEVDEVNSIIDEYGILIDGMLHLIDGFDKLYGLPAIDNLNQAKNIDDISEDASYISATAYDAESSFNKAEEKFAELEEMDGRFGKYVINARRTAQEGELISRHLAIAFDAMSKGDLVTAAERLNAVQILLKELKN